jgi:cyclopropane-fatty-acyl-phospholipid synthase
MSTSRTAGLEHGDSHGGSAPPRDPRLRLALHMAQSIRAGTITLVMPDGATHRVVATPEPAATVVFRDARAVTRLATGGSLGWAEAYLDGFWESPDIRAVMALAAANAAPWAEVLRGRRWTRALAWVAHRLRPNTRRGAARNIVAHYDLGNDFYRLWLDPSMTYSAAVFAEAGEALEAAQARKMRLLCERMALRPGMRVLEIGCGWGGFATMAAGEFGAKVVGLTLSPAQLEFARARVAEAGLSERVELRLQDYRDAGGQFDRIASIEMFEAVGREYWPAYFRAVHDRLAPGGVAGIQTITIEDRWFDDYARTADFIQRHVFPGGMLPSPLHLRRQVDAAGLEWRAAHWFGQDYAETLARWYCAFQRAWPQIARLPHPAGKRHYDARFKRLWEYYLAYCEIGFRAGWTDVGQLILARPS